MALWSSFAHKKKICTTFSRNSKRCLVKVRHMGSFKNHVDIILLFFDHSSTLVDIFYVLNVDKNDKF